MKTNRFTVVMACAVLAPFWASCRSEIELVDLAAAPKASERIALGGDSKRAIVSPLSTELAFPVALPGDAELSFSPAMLTERRVARARVDFRVAVSSDGSDVEVYRREVRAGEANVWHDAKVDLGAWGGKSVTLKLSTEPSSGASHVRWASRVRPAWGEPSIRARRTSPLGPGERPSFIVLLVDTLRADYLGAYGFEAEISPSLDRLAAESVIFENCFSSAPWTKPSVASLFTSLPPAVHGVTGFGSMALTQLLPGEAETLAERFRGAGYRTAAFVANPLVSLRHGFDQGFDIFQRIKDTPRLLATARQWIAKGGREREPFFLYLHVMDVHGPYDAPRPDFEAVLRQIDRGDTRTLTEAEYAQIPTYMQRIEFKSDEERYRFTSWRARYAAGIRVLDRAVGPFLDELRASGVLDRSHFVLTSDHGEELLEHGGWNHGNNLYDHQLHVPLLVRMPLAREAGRRVSSLVSLIDLTPTFAALGGVEAPPGALGRDISSALRGVEPREAAAVFGEAVNGRPGMWSVRTLSHKLIRNEADELELYDLSGDANECSNLASEEPEAVARLESFLRDHQARNQTREALVLETAPIEYEVLLELDALGYVQ
jgi:arylsulfatase A-like enzyme